MHFKALYYLIVFKTVCLISSPIPSYIGPPTLVSRLLVAACALLKYLSLNFSVSLFCGHSFAFSNIYFSQFFLLYLYISSCSFSIVSLISTMSFVNKSPCILSLASHSYPHSKNLAPMTMEDSKVIFSRYLFLCHMLVLNFVIAVYESILSRCR